MRMNVGSGYYRNMETVENTNWNTIDAYVTSEPDTIWLLQFGMGDYTSGTVAVRKMRTDEMALASGDFVEASASTGFRTIEL